MRIHFVVMSILSIFSATLPGISIAQPSERTVPGVMLASFDFQQGGQGWIFVSPSPFISPTPGAANSELQTTTNDNTNTFGFWESPVISDSSPKAEISRGGSGSEELFQASYSVSSNVAEEFAPTVRLRLSTSDFAQSSVFSVTSTGQGTLSPGATHRTYFQFLRAPAGVLDFVLDFDVLNFISSNAANATLGLDSAELSAFSFPLGGTEIANFDFRGGNNNGFVTSTSSELDAPFFASTADGLQIRGTTSSNPNPASTVFGFWRLDSNFVITGGMLYCLEWTVLTDAALGDADKVPAFRFRINDSSLMSGAYLSVESTGNPNLPIPTMGVRETYRHYFLAPSEINNERFFFSFDYLFVPQTNNDPSISVILENLRVLELSSP